MASLWQRWVVANVVGEVIGFGLAGIVLAVTSLTIASRDGGVQLIPAALAIAAMGAIEGGAVGLVQWVVLGGIFPSLARRAWLVATVAGAIAAWAVGMYIGTNAGDALAVADDAPRFAGALAIGALAGAILATPQWLALARAGVAAGWWVPAHAAGWALGMLVAFAAIDLVPADADLGRIALLAGTTGLVMGAVVAAITGLALVAAVRATPSRSPAGR